MGADQQTSRGEAGRIEAIDLARGVALMAMAGFHALWDLSYFGLISIGVGISPLWIAIQRSILVAFLLLVGVGLALAHGDGIRWGSFWRRLAVLVAAAAAVSIATYWMFPDEFAYFGVLHAIALFSLLALPLIRAPVWVPLIVAAMVFALPALWQSELFDSRALSWIGFFVNTPATTDLVPVFPWFGVTLLGIAGERLLRPALPALAAVKLRDPLSRGLRFIGRWSLVFYLVHQPLILAVIYPLAQLAYRDR